MATNISDSIRQNGYPDLKEAVESVMEIQDKIEEASVNAKTKEDRDKITKLHFEKMLRGLFLDYSQFPM